MKIQQTWRFMLAVLLTVGLLLPTWGWNGTALANVPSLDRVRVALFIDTGKFYRKIVPYVTLSSANGAGVELHTTSGNVPVLSWTDQGKRRFSLDQYTLAVLQTRDWNAAKQMQQVLSSQSISSTIWTYASTNSKLYTVVSGSYSTLEKAYAASSSIATATGVTPEIKGAERWVVGKYSSQAEAASVVDQIIDAGFPAYLAYTPTGSGDMLLEVRVGDAIDPAGLDELGQRLQAAFPGVVLTAVDPSIPALLWRSTTLPDGNTMDHYFFTRSQKLWLTPVLSGSTVATTQVSEKDGRRYRGNIELSAYGGNMAVINELPMENYLYSVVSSEMASGWPPEALKAQAVAARTYAVGLGLKYKDVSQRGKPFAKYNRRRS